MIKNYLTTALRNLWRNKLFTVITLTGLSVALTSATIIFLYIRHETSFDKFHQDRERTYRINIMEDYNTEMAYFGCTQFPLAELLRTSFAEYQFTRLYNEPSQEVTIGEKVFKVENILHADSLFFDFFDYEWITGSPAQSLDNIHSVVLTESVAKKLFGDGNPMGQIISLNTDYDFTVTGILKDPPKNSSQPFGMIIPLGFLNKEYLELDIDRWTITISHVETYVKLPAGTDPETFEKKMNEVIQDNIENRITQNSVYLLQSIDEIHYTPDFENIHNTYSTTRKSLLIYAFIGILIIVIAGINFINLSIAQGIKRSREVGIRKVIGASRRQISMIFITETMLLSILALIIAIIITEISLPHINDFLGNNIHLAIYSDWQFILYAIGVILVVTLISGLYPALVLSSFRPIEAIRKAVSGSSHRRLSLRNILLAFQFVISVVLIISSIAISLQMKYILNKDLGFESEDVVVFDLPGQEENDLNAVRRSMESIKEIENYSLAFSSPTDGNNMGTNFESRDSDVKGDMTANIKFADSSYLSTYNLRLLAGSWYPSRHPEDSVFSWVVNERLIGMLGFGSAPEALGKHLMVSGLHGRIIGVVKDFHVYSLAEKIDPIAFTYLPGYFSRLHIKTYPGNTEQVILQAEEALKKIYPKNIIEYNVYWEKLEDMYSLETKLLNIIRFFTIVAIFIAGLGLLGMVSYVIVQRTREIGIRKVLGASVAGIVYQLNRNFIRIIIISNIIAIPLGWYAMHEWLQQFEFRTVLHWWIFALAFILSLLIGLATILFFSVKAALANPVEAIKCE